MLELQRIVYVLRRWWWLLVASTLIGMTVAYALSVSVIERQYTSGATISMAPAPVGPTGLWITTLGASSDASLVKSVQTARAALRMLPPSDRTKLSAEKLARDTSGSASPDQQLLFVQVTQPYSSLAKTLPNVVAKAFIQQERRRLADKYRLVHQGFVKEEQHLAALARSTQGKGPAWEWLHTQYADAASKLYQQDADAGIQASTQAASLQLALPATRATKSGLSSPITAVLGGALAFLVALAFAFAATTTYADEERTEAPRAVLSRIAD